MPDYSSRDSLECTVPEGFLPFVEKRSLHRINGGGDRSVMNFDADGGPGWKAGHVAGNASVGETGDAVAATEHGPRVQVGEMLLQGLQACPVTRQQALGGPMQALA